MTGSAADGPFGARLASLGRPDPEALAAAGLTDGLPAVFPSAELVEAFLAAAPAWGAVPAAIALAPSPPTPWDLAAVAVMAGCPASAFPVVVAALTAMTDPAFNLLGVQTTTSAVAPCTVVGAGAVDPAALVGAGRAIRLALHVLGNVLPGITNLSTMGHPGRLSWCLAESPQSPWEPLAATGRSAVAGGSLGVTVVAAVGSLEVILGAEVPADLAVLAAACHAARSAGLAAGSLRRQVMVVLPPEVAARLAAEGYTRQALSQALWDGSAATSAAPDDPGPGRPLAGEGGRAADVLVAVAGGVGIKGTVVQTWGSGVAVSAPLA